MTDACTTNPLVTDPSFFQFHERGSHPASSLSATAPSSQFARSVGDVTDPFVTDPSVTDPHEDTIG